MNGQAGVVYLNSLERLWPLKIYPVSDLVNSPKTDDARCIEPVRIERNFFERRWWGNDGVKFWRDRNYRGAQATSVSKS